VEAPHSPRSTLSLLLGYEFVGLTLSGLLALTGPLALTGLLALPGLLALLGLLVLPGPAVPVLAWADPVVSVLARIRPGVVPKGPDGGAVAVPLEGGALVPVAQARSLSRGFAPVDLSSAVPVLPSPLASVLAEYPDWSADYPDYPDHPDRTDCSERPER